MANDGSSSLSCWTRVYVNQGDASTPSFDQNSYWEVCSQVGPFTLVDFDGDDNLDVFSTSWTYDSDNEEYTTSINYHHNTDGWTLSANIGDSIYLPDTTLVIATSATNEWYYSIDALDIDLDGTLDLVAGRAGYSSASASVFRYGYCDIESPCHGKGICIGKSSLFATSSKQQTVYVVNNSIPCFILALMIYMDRCCPPPDR